MIKILIPLIFAVAGTGGGIAAGLVLAPASGHEAPSHEADSHASEDAHAPAPEPEPEASHSDGHGHGGHGDDGHSDGPQYVKFDQQFVIPVVEDGELRAMAVVSLGLEVADRYRDTALRLRPKLRDRFLTGMIQHAAMGGFSGTFADPSVLDMLRRELNRIAHDVSEGEIADVLILEIARQDV